MNEKQKEFLAQSGINLTDGLAYFSENERLYEKQARRLTLQDPLRTRAKTLFWTPLRSKKSPLQVLMSTKAKPTTRICLWLKADLRPTAEPNRATS